MPAGFTAWQRQGMAWDVLGHCCFAAFGARCLLVSDPSPCGCRSPWPAMHHSGPNLFKPAAHLTHCTAAELGHNFNSPHTQVSVCCGPARQRAAHMAQNRCCCQTAPCSRPVPSRPAPCWCLTCSPRLCSCLPPSQDYCNIGGNPNTVDNVGSRLADASFSCALAPCNCAHLE